VELKAWGGADQLLDVIEKHHLRDRVIVAAHHHGILQDFRRRAPDVATSASRREALCWRSLAVIGRPVPRPPYRALQVPVHYKGLPIVTGSTVGLAHAAGLKVHAWTIDRPQTMRELLALGVDGVMSDRPDILERVLTTSGRAA
jgi:glycerophosphoryl diester phosphodiesterase